MIRFHEKGRVPKKVPQVPDKNKNKNNTQQPRKAHRIPQKVSGFIKRADGFWKTFWDLKNLMPGFLQSFPRVPQKVPGFMASEKKKINGFLKKFWARQMADGQ